MSSSSQIAMIVYPGSNCDKDCERAFEELFQIKVKRVWHGEKTLPKVRGLILPGGFSYGDYLRSGALAAMSPIMEAIKDHAKQGGTVLGICNGFQVLTESKLLPGTLLPNLSHKFVCKDTVLEPQESSLLWNSTLGKENIKIPVAHKEGRYYIDPEGLKKLKNEKRILLRYKTENPNGSVYDIAGLCSSNGKIMGMMPHPERASLKQRHKSPDGKKILEAFLAETL